MIAAAAHEIGLDGLTLKDVAEHLDVSIAALYHYVSGKDELMQVAASYAAARMPLPEDTGQHWALWLHDWARYNFDAFVAQRGLLGQYLEGAISVESMATNIDTILGVLVRAGFSVTDANAAYDLVSTCAIGSAVATIREQNAAAVGRGTTHEFRRVLAAAPADELPHLRDLAAAWSSDTPPSFETRLTDVLIGIAVAQGRDWRAVVGILEAEAPPARKRRPRRS